MRNRLESRIRNRRELNASLKGPTLGDPDGDVEDTRKWLKRSKKKEQELAKKRQEELESMDKMFQGQKYTEGRRPLSLQLFALKERIACTTDDLVGLKVSHDFEELGEGEARILTLKDSRILDDEGKPLSLYSSLD